MSADDRMDDRLHQSGQRWRAAHGAASAVDLAAATETVPITPVASPKRRKRLTVWLAATAGMAAAMAATLVAIQLRGDEPGRPAAEGAASLVGTDWKLQAMRRADGTPLQVIEPAPLTFGKDTIGGTDGCNHMGGNVTIRDREIVVGDLATTEMACIDRPAGFDAEVSHIHAVLNATVQWSISGERLTLTKPGSGTLVYGLVHHETTTDPRALVGPTWRLTTIRRGGPNGVASTPAALAHVRFGSSGSFDGSDGCNQIGGHAVPGSGTLSGLVLGGTLALCAGAVGEQERMFFDVLSGTVTWSIKDGVLTISKAGVGALVFEKA